MVDVLAIRLQARLCGQASVTFSLPLPPSLVLRYSFFLLVLTSRAKPEPETLPKCRRKNPPFFFPFSDSSLRGGGRVCVSVRVHISVRVVYGCRGEGCLFPRPCPRVLYIDIYLVS